VKEKNIDETKNLGLLKLVKCCYMAGILLTSVALGGD
jgi:hypothetical protein